jgi:hypothetical protein
MLNTVTNKRENLKASQVNPVQLNLLNILVNVTNSLKIQSSTNKTDRHDVTEILLKVALNTIIITLTLQYPKFGPPPKIFFSVKYKKKLHIVLK